MLHERVSINAACFAGAGWSELDAAWTALGARRVGAISIPMLADPQGARAVLGSGRFALETVVHPFMLGHQLDAGRIVLDAERDALLAAIDAAAALGGRTVFMGSGGRGTLSWEDAAEVFCETIVPAADHARQAGIALMIENTPTIYCDLNIALSLRDAVTLAQMAGIGLCLDVFSCWTEAGLGETIARAIPRCGLIQVADFVPGDRSLPGRAVPGDGSVPIRRMLGQALAAGYTGVFDIELMGPRIDAEGHRSAAARASEQLSAMLTELGA